MTYSHWTHDLSTFLRCAIVVVVVLVGTPLAILTATLWWQGRPEEYILRSNKPIANMKDESLALQTYAAAHPCEYYSNVGDYKGRPAISFTVRGDNKQAEIACLRSFAPRGFVMMKKADL